jgi:hypothetical protein
MRTGRLSSRAVLLVCIVCILVAELIVIVALVKP